jgi:DNA polymerase zeta
MMAPQESLSILGAKIGKIERGLLTAHQICTSCSGNAPAEPVECESLDCAWFYARKRAEQRLENIRDMLFIASQLDSGAFDMPALPSDDEDTADSMEM